MALCLVDLKMYDDAIKYYNMAISVMRLGGHILEIAISQINLAHLYFEIDKKRQADDCVKEAIKLLKDQSVEKNGYYAFVCSKCAPSIEWFGYLNEAKEFSKIAEEIYARA